MDRQVKAKEEVLEFGDNPPSGFQWAINLVFLLVRHGVLPYKE